MGKVIGKLLIAISLVVFAIAVFTLLTTNVSAGLAITEENDVFLPRNLHSDEYYTQGADIGWQFTNRTVTGIRERMYTPSNISDPNMRILDRPWAATLSAYLECWDINPDNAIKYGVEAGVMGPDANGKFLQSTIHKWIGSPEPKGWAYQMPGEPILQLYGEYWTPVFCLGTPGSWGSQLYLPIGCNVGTTYINASGGLAFTAGWNPHAITMDISIPKLSSNSSKGFCCFTAAGRYYYVAHNATLGSSFFHDSDARWMKNSWEVDITPSVLEGRIGVIAGYGLFSAGYYIESRTREFETQGPAANWATLRFGLGTEF